MAEPYAAAGGLVRVYPRPRCPNGAGLVWAHGGGFAGGDLDMPEADWRRPLPRGARRRRCVSVDYRARADAADWAEVRGTPPRRACTTPRHPTTSSPRGRWASRTPHACGSTRPVGRSAARVPARNLATGRNAAPARARLRAAARARRARLPDAPRRAARTGCRAARRARRRPRGRHASAPTPCSACTRTTSAARSTARRSPRSPGSRRADDLARASRRRS